MSWPRRLAAFVLYAAIMLAIGWALKQVIPPSTKWFRERFGSDALTVILVMLIVAAGAYAWRDSARRRRLRGPRG